MQETAKQFLTDSSNKTKYKVKKKTKFHFKDKMIHKKKKTVFFGSYSIAQNEK